MNSSPERARSSLYNSFGYFTSNLYIASSSLVISSVINGLSFFARLPALSAFLRSIRSAHLPLPNSQRKSLSTFSETSGWK